MQFFQLLQVTCAEKNQTKNVALQGTHCISGSGKGLVIQTGDNTVLYAGHDFIL